MKDDESIKEEVEVKKMKEGTPPKQDDSPSIEADEDPSSSSSTVKTEQIKLEHVKSGHVKTEGVKMDIGASSSSSSSASEAGWEEVPLRYYEELELVLREEGVIDDTLENPHGIIWQYIDLEEEIKLTDDDYAARADLGEKALQDLIEEVEGINDRTIRELGQLSSDQKELGVFMLLKVLFGLPPFFLSPELMRDLDEGPPFCSEDGRRDT